MRHSSKKLTQEEFIRRSSEAHNNYYDYSLAIYKNSSTSVSIICPEHGITTQHAGNHMAGYRTKCCIKTTTNEYLRRFTTVHGDKYDYSKAIFASCEDKIEIICKEHGSFWQTPTAHHRLKQGCPRCAKDRAGKWKISNTEIFTAKAVAVHGAAYDYSKVEYYRSSQKVEIICNNCKESFFQRPNLHLKGQGCRSCNLSGFTHSRPGHFYILEAPEMVKVGITNKNPQHRVAQLYGAGKGIKFEPKHSFLFESGKAASLVENIILADFREKYNNPERGFHGYSECFLGLTFTEALEHIRYVLSTSGISGYSEISYADSIVREVT